jgi:hypothetical protein
MATRLVRQVVAGRWQMAVGAVLLATGTTVQAQLIAPRTVPVFQGNQFAILPSASAAIGGVSLALDDSLPDGFSNPAKMGRISAGSFFAAPFSHSISENRGGGRTLPVGGIGRMGEWAFGGVYATQELERAGPMRFATANSDRSASNQYLALTVARNLPGGLKLGAGGTFASLAAVDGVDLLYGGSDNIRQRGSSSDLRLGLSRDFGKDRTFDFLVVHHRYEMTHTVRFPSRTTWDTQFSPPRPQQTPAREEVNDDRSHIWGAHAEYTQPVGELGWKLGWIATANRLTHPKIPNYVLQNIPRDPGHSTALNLGVGLGRTITSESGRTTFGFDVVLEPMTSTTWADAANDTAVVGGGTIKAGGKTVENDFRFNNSLIRVGFGQEFFQSKDSSSAFGFQLGLAVYSIKYRLEQQNNVQKTFRTQDEHWKEMTPTFGLSYKDRAYQLHYTYNRTCASECVDFGGDRVTVASPDAAGSGGPPVVAAPSSPLTFSGGRASIHKIWIAVPIK